MICQRDVNENLCSPNIMVSSSLSEMINLLETFINLYYTPFSRILLHLRNEISPKHDGADGDFGDGYGTSFTNALTNSEFRARHLRSHLLFETGHSIQPIVCFDPLHASSKRRSKRQFSQFRDHSYHYILESSFPATLSLLRIQPSAMRSLFAWRGEGDRELWLHPKSMVSAINWAN